jgi:hypothetical protein
MPGCGLRDLVLLVTLSLSGFVFTVLDGDWIRCSAVVDPAHGLCSTQLSHRVFGSFYLHPTITAPVFSLFALIRANILQYAHLSLNSRNER